VSQPWGDPPPPEEAHHEAVDEVDEPRGEVIDHVDDPPTDFEAEVDVAADEAPGDEPDVAPADEDLVAGQGPVAAAVARLDSLAGLPPVEHVEVYEDVHRVLQDALADAAHDSGGDGSGADGGGADGSGEDRTGAP
jgi:hypothetical protein